MSCLFVLFHVGLVGYLKNDFLSPRFWLFVAKLIYSCLSIITGPKFLSALLIMMLGLFFSSMSAAVSSG